MTKAEIAATVDSLNEEELMYLSAYLKIKQLINDDSFKQKASEQYKIMKQGRTIASNQVKELHNQLAENGL